MALSLPVPEREHEEAPHAGGAALRAALSEQLAPLVACDAWLARECERRIAPEPWRERAGAGRLPYAPTDAFDAFGELAPAYLRAVDAIERAGLASNRAAGRARQLARALHPLLVSWLAGEAIPGAHARAAARGAATLVGHAVLRRVSAAVRDLAPVSASATSCPCCGGAPDLAFIDGPRRTLVCSRCDARWESTVHGCLSCGAASPPSLARVHPPHTGCSVAVCSPCGRYIKELAAPVPPPAALLVERALLRPVDDAALLRGIRG